VLGVPQHTDFDFDFDCDFDPDPDPDPMTELAATARSG
jgi:hypothetical protein